MAKLWAAEQIEVRAGDKLDGPTAYGGRVAFALLLIASWSCSLSAQSTKIDRRLIGKWRSVEIRCAADEECANTANEAQLEIDEKGNFQWIPYRDLKKLDLCWWDTLHAEPGALEYEDCDGEAGPDHDSDTIEYRLSGNVLILTGRTAVPNPHDSITMRFERGRLASDWREPSPEVCNTAPAPQWTASARLLASDWDFAMQLPNVTDRQAAIAKRNRLLWEALKAYKGTAPPIALKALSYSIEGDEFEDYLFASRNKVEVVEHVNGHIEETRTCTRPVPIIKLKVQDSSHLWRFVRTAPSSVTPAYIAFPANEDSGPYTFPWP
jgi:hypothetical protein